MPQRSQQAIVDDLSLKKLQVAYFLCFLPVFNLLLGIFWLGSVSSYTYDSFVLDLSRSFIASLTVFLCFQFFSWLSEFSNPQHSYFYSLLELVVAFFAAVLLGKLISVSGPVDSSMSTNAVIHFEALRAAIFLIELLFYHSLSLALELYQKVIVVSSGKKEVELKHYRSLIPPHFMFNSLNLLLIESKGCNNDVESAVYSLSSLLTGVVRLANRKFASIEEEVSMVSSYLSIMEKRFAGRFSYELKIDQEIMQCCLPSVSLLPIVENSIKHGIVANGNQGFVLLKITLDRMSGNVVISVLDSGRYEPALVSNDGLGLGVVSETMKNFYQENYKMRVINSSAGTLFRIEVPVTTQSDIANV